MLKHTQVPLTPLTPSLTLYLVFMCLSKVKVIVDVNKNLLNLDEEQWGNM